MALVLNLLKIIILAVLVILFAPGIPPFIKFEAYTIPPPHPLEGVLAKNAILDRATPIKLDRFIRGPESIAVRGDEIYTGIDGGELIKVKNGKVTTVVEKFGEKCDGLWDAKHCGRIAGLRFDSKGKLYAADVAFGIFKVDVDTGKYKQLVNLNEEIEGTIPRFPDDLDIGSDGKIYWSDATTNADVDGLLIEALGEPSGRLIQYDPKTKKNTVLLKGLHFANGVQLSKNEDFVLVSDMVQSRVMRCWLKGPMKGACNVFMDRLPGMPDNVRSNGKDGFYIVMGMARAADDFDLSRHLGSLPLVRKFIVRSILLITSSLKWIESNLIPSVKLREWIVYIGNLGSLEDLPPKVIIVETDANGTIIGSLQNNKGPIARLSEIDVGPEFTYFGSPSLKQIYRMKTSELRK